MEALTELHSINKSKTYIAKLQHC